MNFALEAVKTGSLSIGQASRQFNVPETTLREYSKRSGITAGIASRAVLPQPAILEPVVAPPVVQVTTDVESVVAPTVIEEVGADVEPVVVPPVVHDMADAESVGHTTIVKSKIIINSVFGIFNSTNVRISDALVFGKKGNAKCIEKTGEVHSRSAYYPGRPDDDDVDDDVVEYIDDDVVEYVDDLLFVDPAPNSKPYTLRRSPRPLTDIKFVAVTEEVMEVICDGSVGDLTGNPPSPLQLLVEYIFTPSPTPSPRPTLPQLPTLPSAMPCLNDPYEFVASEPEHESPPRHQSPDLLGPLPEPMDVVMSSDDDSLRPRRMTVAERQAIKADTQMVKYCPLCDFMTSGHKLGRHLENRHRGHIKKPRKMNITNICQFIASESRKSFSIVPLRVVQKKLGPYWDDRCYRSIAHELTIMGRMKTYGGSWNLPGVSDMRDPFSKYLCEESANDMAEFSQKTDPTAGTSGVVPNNIPVTTAQRAVTPENSVPNTDAPPSAS
ncbi:hypothetical protein ACI65C_003984 [Semiaphis heraclei]